MGFAVMNSGIGESEADRFVAVESDEDVATAFLGDDKQLFRNGVERAVTPNLFLEFNAELHFFHRSDGAHGDGGTLFAKRGLRHFRNFPIRQDSNCNAGTRRQAR